MLSNSLSTPPCDLDIVEVRVSSIATDVLEDMFVIGALDQKDFLPVMLPHLDSVAGATRVRLREIESE
jgi:hypothetical protein